MDYEFTSNRKCSLSEGYTYTTPTPDIHDRIYDTNTTRRQKAKKKKGNKQITKRDDINRYSKRKRKKKKVVHTHHCRLAKINRILLSWETLQ